MRFLGRHQQPFGEAISTWEIITDEPEDEVWKFCMREICSNRPVMTKGEWEKGINEDMDFSEYIKGYVRLVKVHDCRWWFEKHFPNLD